MDNAEILGMEAVRQVPRAMGLMDRDRASRTAGCADRYFWHYKFHDYPNARFQEISELLALAFLYKHPKNPFHQNSKARDWAVLAVRFWESLAHGDGSFDEAYPFERSFCATSFSTFHTTQTLLLLGEKPAVDLSSIGRWLSNHDSPDTANQRAASAAALASLSVIDGNDSFLRAAKNRANVLREEFSKLGYFNEYGGNDTGYTSITLSCLASYADAARDAEFGAWVRERAAALGRELNNNGAYIYGGQSRATRFFYPYALAWSNDAALNKISIGVEQDKILKPSWMDDRYMIAFAADHLRSAHRLSGQEKRSA